MSESHDPCITDDDLMTVEHLAQAFIREALLADRITRESTDFAKGAFLAGVHGAMVLLAARLETGEGLIDAFKEIVDDASIAMCDLFPDTEET